MQLARAVALVAGLAGCSDAARDERYVGAPLFRLVGFMGTDQATTVLLGGSAATVLAAEVQWSVPGAAPLIEPQRDFDVTRFPRFVLDLRTTPPKKVLRDPDDLGAPARDGGVALGQLVVFADQDGDGLRAAAEPLLGVYAPQLAWSPRGAEGAALTAALPAGVSVVWVSAPCEAPRLRVSPLGHDPETIISLSEHVSAAQLFASPQCPSAVAARTVNSCADGPTAARWLCRDGPAPELLCAACEYQLYPEGGDAAACQTWYQRCLSARLDITNGKPECRAERDFCLGDEPRAAPCDLACACAKFQAYCDSLGITAPSSCGRDLPGCNWLATPAP